MKNTKSRSVRYAPSKGFFTDLVSKSSESYHMLSTRRNMADFPLVESILEIIHHGHLICCRIQQNDSQTSGDVHHAKTDDDIRTRAISNSDTIFDP